MNILLGFHYYRYPFDVKEWVERWIKRISLATGHSIKSFCLTLNPPGHPLSWPELDAAWKRGDPKLLKMYEALARAAEGCDAVINWNSINLHPEFVRQLPQCTAFCCCDDPESSDNLSKPVAASYDLCLVSNAAAVDNYRNWDAKNVEFWPLGFHADDFDPQLTKQEILDGKRDVPVTLLCERETSWRRARLDQYSAAFPEGSFYGRGWPKGFIDETAKIPLYQKTKIGPNFHNSTGPINFRTYILPANGVMQLCDNKSHLGKIFELNREVAGFDTVDEAIELTRYYLSHDEERRAIAAAGWERATREYNEVAVFEKAVAAITRVTHARITAKKSRPIRVDSMLRGQRIKTTPLRVGNRVKKAAGTVIKSLRKIKKKRA